VTDCVLVIAAYNEQARIADCLHAIQRSPLPASFRWRQWILIDDASADATVAAMTAWRDSHSRSPVDIVRNPERLGKAGAIERTHRRLVDEGFFGDVVVIVDADVLVEAVTLAELLEPLAAHPATAVVTGIGWPDQRTWGRRASAFQLLLTARLTRSLGPDIVRAEGRLTAYRVGPFAEMTWRPGYVHDDTQMAAFALRRGLRGHSSSRARVVVTPARGYRDFYNQTYRSYAARRALVAAGGPELVQAGPLQAGVAVATAARQDPVGAAAYLAARLVSVVRHRVAPLAFSDAWDQARSTKIPRPDPSAGWWRNQALGPRTRHGPGPSGQRMASLRRRRRSPPAPTTSASPAAVAADTASAAWAADSGS
jgi:hypothetical protein